MKFRSAVFLFLAAVLLYSRPLLSFPGRYFRFEHLLPESGGQAVTGISSVMQDRDGFLWFGTIAGLACYDGYRFLFFSPLSGADGEDSPAPAVIYPVIEDSRGDIWAGTDSQGLLRFDKRKEEFVRYRHDPADPASLSGDTVISLQEDKTGGLWVGTRSDGLSRFDPKTRTFKRIPLDPGAGAVWDLLVDSRGILWAGTQEGGLYRLDPVSGKTSNFRSIPDGPRSLGSNTVWSIFEDSRGTIWVGTRGGGLNRFVPEAEEFIRFAGDEAHPRDLVSPPITAIAEDAFGRLWIGTAWSGLRIWDPRTGEYTVVRHDSQDSDSLIDDSVTSILRDASGVMWIGTAQGGIGKCPADQAKFAHYKHNRHDPRSISRNEVRSLWAGEGGYLWIGFDEGLDEIDERTGEVRRFRNDPSYGRTIGPGAVQALARDGRGRLWVGMDGHGLYAFDPRTGRFDRHLSDPSNPATLSHNRVNVLRADTVDRGVVWAGTQHGLSRLDTRTGRFTRYLYDASDASSLSSDIVTALLSDRSGSLWVGTGEGLNRLDKARGRFERYGGRTGASSGSGPVDGHINCLYEDRAGILWVGTNNGLSRFDAAAGTWDDFGIKNGLPGRVVCGILEDDSGRLWISTNRGLARLDPRNRTFASFSLQDGVQENEFTPGACARGADGRLYFGGTNGFNAVRPEEVRPNPFVPPVVWTGYSQDGREAEFGNVFFRPGELRLSSQVETHAFEFAAMCYLQPGLNRFAYRLEPRDREWIPMGTKRTVTLGGLKPGDYRLRVKASNPDGVWNEKGFEAALRIVPPFWKTTWFAVLALLFLAAGAATVVRMWLRLRSAATVIGDRLDGLIDCYGLTSREQEILRLILQGDRNKDIQRKLFISASTVRNHIYNIYIKLGVGSRLELINRIGRDAQKKA